MGVLRFAQNDKRKTNNCNGAWAGDRVGSHLRGIGFAKMGVCYLLLIDYDENGAGCGDV